jgi:transcriptional regulator of acetoin/glycerol metabolism
MAKMNDFCERYALTSQLYRVVGKASLTALRESRSEITGDDVSDVGDAPEQMELTADAIQAAMQKVSGNATLAAKTLGISRATLYNTLRRLHMKPRDLRAGS